MSAQEEKVETVTTEPTTEDDDAPKADDEDTGGHYTPLVKLEEVAVATGEEDEEVLFEIKSKLYRFDKAGNQWKERGVGQCKLLEHKETKKIRLLMRQQKILKIVANHAVLPGIALQEHAGSDKSLVWATQDFSEGELKEELFTMRFGSVESLQRFKDAFESAQEKMADVLGVSPAKPSAPEVDEAAESLEKLAVKIGEKAPEEKEKEETKEEEKPAAAE